jgi:hypothetical protein
LQVIYLSISKQWVKGAFKWTYWMRFDQYSMGHFQMEVERKTRHIVRLLMHI